MKPVLLLLMILFSADTFAQKSTALPHGMVFGKKPDTSGIVEASKVETFMGKKVRISTTIKGKVIKVTRQKGGWFELDAGKDKIIAAHFKDYKVTIPTNLQGSIVIIDGVAAKQFIADDSQHFAGDTVVGKKQHTVNANPKRKLVFEVKGLMVDVPSAP